MKRTLATQALAWSAAMLLPLAAAAQTPPTQMPAPPMQGIDQALVNAVNASLPHVGKIVAWQAVRAVSDRTALYAAPEPGSYALPEIMRVSDHKLLASNGKREKLLGLAPGELALVSFVYLSCNQACPAANALMDQMDGALAEVPELADRVKLVTVSFDPERDTPQALGELRSSLDPQGRWSFLTAKSTRQIRKVLKDFGQDALRVPTQHQGHGAEAEKLRHVLKLFLVDSEGSVRNIYSTGLLDPRLLMSDIATLAMSS